MPIRLYVGNLPKEPIERQALQSVFAEEGDSVSTKVIKDRKTGKCRGFAFVTVLSDEMADEFIEKYNGQPFMDSSLKIEKALPRVKGQESEDGSTPDMPEVVESTIAKPSTTNKKTSKKRARTPDSPQADSFRPDPRWADELAKLKEMLTASSN